MKIVHDSRKERNRVSRLRRKARRLGYVIRKSRAYRPPDIMGGYMIVDPSTNAPHAGWNYDLGLDGVEQFLKEQDKEE